VPTAARHIRTIEKEMRILGSCLLLDFVLCRIDRDICEHRCALCRLVVFGARGLEERLRLRPARVSSPYPIASKPVLLLLHKLLVAEGAELLRCRRHDLVCGRSVLLRSTNDISSARFASAL
jgi:hypothetical protein